MARGVSTGQLRIRRYLATAVLFVAVLVGLGIVVPRPLFGSVDGAIAQGAGTGMQMRTVLMLSSAIHTDLAFPADPDVVERFAFLMADGLDPSQTGVDYVVAGWGGRSFYIETPEWSDLKPGPVLSALTLDRSVMHIGIAGAIDPAHPSVTAIDLDREAFERLLDAVLDSFAAGAEGRPKAIAGANYGDYDRFYEAKGWFNAIVGCNVWTARMLRQAQLTTGWWTPLPVFLNVSLSLHNSLTQPGYKPVAR
ncbi:MAG: TIGR02117 family protein [Hoeflea sp.]|uniref:TIGR02117 family protein n=1 Tax=Hoeflea sp. TaxID=1940281 RepID=UPI003EF72959